MGRCRLASNDSHKFIRQKIRQNERASGVLITGPFARANAHSYGPLSRMLTHRSRGGLFMRGRLFSWRSLSPAHRVSGGLHLKHRYDVLSCATHLPDDARRISDRRGACRQEPAARSVNGPGLNSPRSLHFLDLRRRRGGAACRASEQGCPFPNLTHRRGGLVMRRGLHSKHRYDVLSHLHYLRYAPPW